MDTNNQESAAGKAISIDSLYQRMVEEIQDYAIILLDKHGIIRNWNAGAQKIKGYTEQEILGRHFSIFYLQEDLDNDLPRKLMKLAADTGRAAQEGWRRRRDGSRFWGSISINALHDDAGNVIAFAKVTRDLTEKKMAEDRLRMSEERYHRMIAEVQDYAIILLSAEGVIENWNAGAESIKGYRSEEIVGRKFEVFYTPEDRASGLPYKLLGLAREHGKATDEGWRLRKDGTKFWGSITITALHGKDRDIIGFSKVTRDLTQQKFAQEQLAAYTAELEIQNSELEQFAFVASHDLQEPLRKIQIFTALIQENHEDAGFVTKYLERLNASAKRMSELVKSLLNFSRIGNDREQSGTREVDLNIVLEEAREDLELVIAEKQAIIHGATLPTVSGNHSQLGQLFSNLIANALKFSARPPVVSITARKISRAGIRNAPHTLTAPEYHHISFQDNGIGFEEQYNSKIFALFQRLHGKQEYAGTGIGLALCKKIAESHHGFIDATGAPGEGATFNLYLPAGEPE